MRTIADGTGSSDATTNALRAALLECQRRVLERIASGAPLEEILEALVRLIEKQASGIRCAVLVADTAEQRLRVVAAPSIPEDYTHGMEPYLRIAPNMPACGTAAYLREPVYAKDIATDPLWEGCAGIALRNGIRAAWSTPILSDENRVLGTFAMFYGEPQLPSAEHIQLIDMATQLARVAIEAAGNHDLVRVVFENAPQGMLITDLAGTILAANRALAAALWYTPAELEGKNIEDIADAIDYPAMVKQLLARKEELASVQHYRKKGGKILFAHQRSSLRGGADGERRYVLTHIDSLGNARPDPAVSLSRREREVLELVASGLSSKDIATRLGISPASVDTYRSRLMRKLDIEGVPDLVRFAIRNGIVPV